MPTQPQSVLDLLGRCSIGASNGTATVMPTKEKERDRERENPPSDEGAHALTHVYFANLRLAY